MWRRALLLTPLLIAQLGCSPGAPAVCDAGSATCTRVLFIGNSYTQVNDLPAMFETLSQSGGRAVQATMLAHGGWTLQNHLAAPATASTITGTGWSVVVLQDQSELPATESGRQTEMWPAARGLVQLIRAHGAHPMFFETWGHRDGLVGSGLDTYQQMQAALDAAYLGIATEQHAAVAPVGDAWSAVQGLSNVSSLWQSDWSHPSLEGTYLAACVFYAAIFKKAPDGLAYTAGLPAPEAAVLQHVAGETVLKDSARWGLA